MEDEPKYKLIHAVDPRKVNAPIRDKFAKLTLSNKKKKEEEVPAEESEQQIQPQQMENRDSVSRNLLALLQGDNDTSASAAYGVATSIAGTSSSHRTSLPTYINPLLRSDSEETQIDEADLLQYCEEEYTEAQPAQENSDFMQPLQVSEEFSQLPNMQVEQQVEILSQRISIMTMSNSVETKLESTLLVSTESQRMSDEFSTQRLQVQAIAKSKDISNMSECILVSSETEPSEDEIESNDAITVSDTSISMCSWNGEMPIDFEAVTSNIPYSGETTDAILPNTFSNERADRMEAFLRDVSQQRKEMERIGLQVEEEDVRENETKMKAELTEKVDSKAREIAIADTESMSSLDQHEHATPLNAGVQALIENDTISMHENENICSMFLQRSEQMSLERKSNSNSNEANSRRFAADETEPNTLVSNAELSIHSTNETIKNSFTANESGHEIPDESIVISETSSEALKNSPPRAGMSDNSNCEKSSKELASSEQAVSSEDNSPATLTTQLSQLQMDIGSINISAKINIKIQISQVESSNESAECADTPSENDDNDSSVADGDEKQSAESSPDIKKNEIEVHARAEQQQKRQVNLRNILDNSADNEDAVSVVEDEVEDDEFLTHAERLLNKLYGQSWKTPDVIRTLKRTTSGNKMSSSAEQNLSTGDTEQTPVCTKRPVRNVEKSLPTVGVEQTPVCIKKTVKSAREYEKICTSKDETEVDKSVLDDFSIFRRNIVKTNLDSTRLVTPKTNSKKKSPLGVKINSEPRRLVKGANKPVDAGVFKVPQTEVRKRTISKQTNRRILQTRWRQLVDDEADSSGDNASDDESINKTGQEDSNDTTSTNSWSQASDDSDYSITTPTRTKNTRNKPNTTRNRVNNTTRRAIKCASKQKDALVYLDLSQEEVTVQENIPDTPPANNDANFNTRLQEILRTCKPDEKPKLPATPGAGGKTKRKLFTARFGAEEEMCLDDESNNEGIQKNNKVSDDEILLHEMDELPGSGCFDIVNKHLEALKRGTPIFKMTPPHAVGTRDRVKPKAPNDEAIKTSRSPKSKEKVNENTRVTDRLLSTPKCKYGFLKSLDVRVAKSLCHPDALYYRENYRLRKEELANILYELYNEKLFDDKLAVPLVWNKKLCNTAGRCLNKKRLGVRSCVVELSEKVLTSADRLRCTLIHELCHAATWIFNGEGGHGCTWKTWARKANTVFPEIPKIGVCHQYDIEYKYTYKCTLCAAKSHAHSKSKKVENIRCAFCHGAIEIFLNKKDKDGNIMPTPVKEPTGFAKFVKDNYKQYKRPDLKHADVMKILSNEFAALKVPGNGN